jgi:hypothetical protein
MQLLLQGLLRRRWRAPLLLAASSILASPAWAKGGVDMPAVPTTSLSGVIATDWQLGTAGFHAPLPASEQPATAANDVPEFAANDPLDSSVPGELQNSTQQDPRYRTFGSRVGAVKWETAGIFSLLTAVHIGNVANERQSFRFQDEGLFGKDTANLGLDKLAHAYNTYLISEVLYRRMERKTGGGPASAVTAAVLGSGLQIYAEIYDGLHAGSGFSVADVGFNMSGAAFSALRNTVPGLKEKLDFRIMIVPNNDFYTRQGKKHFEQEHFIMALKLAGFAGLRNSPLRFVELHAGYRAKDFTIPERLAGVRPQRLPFLGVGFNFAELFLKGRQSFPASAARTILQYYQLPYTAVHVDLPTGKLSP